MDDNLVNQLDELAAAMDRPRTWLIEQAVRRYIEEQAWQVQAIQAALDDYRSGDAVLVPHEEVMDRLEARIKGALQE
jgi:predicted transcriptional regulator